MKRRELIHQSAALGALAAIPVFLSEGWLTTTQAYQELSKGSDAAPAAVPNPLTPPASGHIPVAFVISDGAVMIDFTGPWEVFQDVMILSRGKTMDEQMPFRLYTVAEKMAVVRTSGGMKIQPDYTFANAPAPKVIVIPAQDGASDAMLAWIRNASQHADVTMSVCTGAFILAKAGLLSGKAATTHHSSYRQLAMEFPDVHVKPGVRFVEAGNVASSGGLSSGIDLALRVVERYYGRKVAADTAYNMEYQGRGWTDPGANAIYAKALVSTKEHPLCPVCLMEVDRATASSSVYKGKTYYFCSDSHKAAFDAGPQKWL
jgi:putative intracellular protease/amidase/YHS domain-containing protein